MTKLRQWWEKKTVRYVAKVVGIALVLMVYLILDDPKPKTKVFTYEGEGYQEEVKFTYRKDEVIEENSKTTIPYEELGFADATEAQAQLGEYEATCNQVRGFVMTHHYQEANLVQTVHIDYEVADLQELIDLELMTLDGDPEDGISMARTEEGYLEDGYQFVKGD